MNSDGGSLFKKQLMNDIIEYAYPQLKALKELPPPKGYVKCEGCQVSFDADDHEYAYVTCEIDNCDEVVFCDASWCKKDAQTCGLCRRYVCSSHADKCCECTTIVCPSCYACLEHVKSRPLVEAYHPVSKRLRLTNLNLGDTIPEVTKKCISCWEMCCLSRTELEECKEHIDCFVCEHGDEPVCDSQLLENEPEINSQ